MNFEKRPQPFMERVQPTCIQNRSSTGKWELHMNTMGWTISDTHYEKWKNNIGKRFKAPKVKKAVVGDNKGQTRLVSTAVYCYTIFWSIQKNPKK